LAGRGWRILGVDWRRRQVHVELTEGEGRTRYYGTTRLLGSELCRSIGAVLAGDDPGVPLSRRAVTALDESRRAFPGLQPGPVTYLQQTANGATRWWTFAGLRANLELAARLGTWHSGSAGNLAITVPHDTTADELRAALDLTTPVDNLLELA